jgi:hypothetical protein
MFKDLVTRLVSHIYFSLPLISLRIRIHNCYCVLYKPRSHVYIHTDIHRPELAEEAPRVERQQNMVISPAGLGTKNDCADGDKQKFTPIDPAEMCYPLIEERSSKWTQLSTGFPPARLRKEIDPVP